MKGLMALALALLFLVSGSDIFAQEGTETGAEGGYQLLVGKYLGRRSGQRGSGAESLEIKT